jgi:hypothetical protein
LGAFSSSTQRKIFLTETLAETFSPKNWWYLSPKNWRNSVVRKREKKRKENKNRK